MAKARRTWEVCHFPCGMLSGCRSATARSALPDDQLLGSLNALPIPLYHEVAAGGVPRDGHCQGFAVGGGLLGQWLAVVEHGNGDGYAQV